MRLVTKVTYIYTKSPNRLFIIIFLTFINSFLIPSYAQNYLLKFNNIPLSQALSQVASTYHINIAFDAEKLGNVSIKKKINGNVPEDLIRKLLENTGFSYEYKHDTFLIIDVPDNPSNPVMPVYQLIGSVSDIETGEQLTFASVSITNESVTSLTSDNGTFFFKKLGSSPAHLQASYIGYYQADTTLALHPILTICDIKLKRKFQAFDTIVVKGPPPEMIDLRNNVDFATAINPSKLMDLPQLTGTDVFQTLQLLPGINYSENSSELSIRGGTSDQNLILYDGQTLYNISHFFGLFSAINPYIIKDIQVYKGGFDSRYGERISGIVDITGKSGNQLKPNIYGDLNLVSGSIAAEIPVSNKITFVGATRRSYADIYATSLTQTMLDNSVVRVEGDKIELINQSTPSYYFYDYNAKLTYHINNREGISLSVYGGYDTYDNTYHSINHDTTTPAQNIYTVDYTTWGNYGVSALWQKQWNGSLYSSLLASASGYSSNYTNTTQISSFSPSPYLPDSVNTFETFNKNKLSDQSIQFRNIWYVNNNHQLDFGILSRRNEIIYHKDADKVYVYDNINLSAITSSAYIQDKITVYQKITIKPGIRANYYSNDHNFYVEPRFSINYRFNNQFSIRAALGRYYQFISKVSSRQETGYYKSFWVLSGNSDRPVQYANHFIAGCSFEKKNFLFDIETYYKAFSGITEYIFISPYLRKDFGEYYFSKEFQTKRMTATEAATSQASYYIHGKGRSYGIDFLFRYKYRHLSSWLSYSLSKTTDQFPEINNNRKFPSTTDQPHQVSWANMVTIKKWNLGSIVLYSTGRPYYSTDVQPGNTDMVRTYERTPDYFRTDISANYSFRLYKARLKAGITIINLFNTSNYFDINNRKFDFENASFSETNLIRSQNLSFNIFLNFSL